MTLEGRVDALERSTPAAGPIRIKVIYVPGNLPRDEVDTWVAAHPEALGRVIELIPGGGTRLVYSNPAAARDPGPAPRGRLALDDDRG
jgi:hypothetical protein